MSASKISVFILPLLLCTTLSSAAPLNQEEVDVTYSKTRTLFEMPGNDYRGKPFWSWNGTLQEEELLRQIDVLDEMGFGGFFMHSRTGLATEYLGEEWFRLINVCADEAEKRGLEAWLYDEDRWPSGSAGGKATEDPQYRMQYLKMDRVKGTDFVWDDNLVAAFACDLDGINVTGCVPLSADSPKTAYAKNTVLSFRVVLMDNHSFYNGNTYLDTLNKEATEHFIDLTHGEYKRHCGDRLGSSIKGIFTDEPHRGMVMCKNVSQGTLTDSEFCTPWTGGLRDAFQARFGYDLAAHLPELFLRKDGARISPVKWQYMELIQQLFLDNFAKPIQAWCQENNMILTGHVLHEDTLGAQAVPCGSMMRFYEYMDYPGVDVLTEGNRNYWVVKQLSSAARQLDKRWLLSELYGCTGWQFNFESHKAVGDWQSLFGINLRCHHLSWYTMEGEAKRDYPASILHQSGWYPDYEAVELYFSRLQAVMSQGQADCDILVLNPVESAWAQIHAGWATWLTAIAPEVQALDRQYRDIFHWLSGAQLDFDLGDEDIMHRHGTVLVEDGTALLRIGAATYTTVVVSGMETIRGTTLDLLEEFAAQGGRIIVAGNAPSHADALPSERPAALPATAIPFEREAVVTACEAAGRPVSVTAAEDGAPLTQIFCQSRTDGGLRYVLALNTNRDKGFENCKVRIQGEGTVEAWDCLRGTRHRITSTQEDGAISFIADFPKAGEKLYVVTPHSDPSIPMKPAYTTVQHESLKGPYAYSLNEPNICLLDRATYRVDRGEWQEAREILKVDRALRDQFDLPQRGGEMLQPWFAGQTPAEVQAQVALRFDFEVETMPDALHLLMERPEYFEIYLNNTRIASDSVDGWMIDTCLQRLALPVAALNAGENFIELRAGFHEDLNLEALYLTGDFGVHVEASRRILTSLPETLKVGDVTAQGLPFYSGRIQYHIPAQPAVDGAEAFLATPAFEGACVQVYGGNGTGQIIPWAPYEAEVTALLATPFTVEVVLTRRNTFGPHHQIPLKAGGYGPGNWHTGGERFTENYMLYPAGLLQAPELVWKTNR